MSDFPIYVLSAESDTGGFAPSGIGTFGLGLWLASWSVISFANVVVLASRLPSCSMNRWKRCWPIACAACCSEGGNGSE